MLDIGEDINSAELVCSVRGRKVGPGIIDSKGVETADLEMLEANWANGDRSSVLKALIGNIKGRGGRDG